MTSRGITPDASSARDTSRARDASSARDTTIARGASSAPLALVAPPAPRGEVASWRALGTYVQLQVADDAALPSARTRAEDLLDEVDRACSRFRRDSDLTRANDRPGRWTKVSPVLVGAVRVALEAAHETCGLVDPALGAVIEAAGYDRTFTLLSAASRVPASLPVAVRPGAWRDVEVVDDAILVPDGVRLDLGATGKAFASDLVAADISDHLGTPVVVSVGGDVAVSSPVDRPRSWPVAVGETVADLETSPEATVVVQLASGGLATSTLRARRWERGGQQWHHVLDPHNGLPVAGPWRSVTAVGHTCSAANAATTAALVLGHRAMDWLVERDVAALLVDQDGAMSATPAWTRSGSPSPKASR